MRLEKGTTEFKKFFKQIPVPFKVYANIECHLESVESYKGSCSKKYRDHIPCSFAYMLVCVDVKFSKPIAFLEVKMLLTNLLKQFLKSISIVKK